MPSIRYVNQTAPFWDFVASVEQQGTQHPFFSRGTGESSDEEPAAPWGPWGPWAHRRWHRGGMPHHAHPHHRGPPPPGPHGPPPPPPGYDAEGSPDTLMGDAADEKNEKRAAENSNEKTEAGPSTARDGDNEPREGCRRGRGKHFGAGERGRCGGRGGFGARRGPWGRHAPFPFAFGAGAQPWADFLQSQIFGEDNNKETGEQADFTPDLDVFDTESSYVVHVSLPGAKKEDVGVNWDPEKSELSVAGVIYRPGDEELLKTLAMDGRKVGPFENKVRLGSRANPAQVDSDAITAKLEDGILIIEVPKLDKDYVEVKKVDIE